MLSDPRVLQWMTFASIFILGYPVWSMNKRKRAEHRTRKELAELKKTDPDRFSTRLQEAVLKAQEDDIRDWRMLDEICLWVGYLLLIFSSFMTAWNTPATG